jgi:hypothetical protein
MLDCRLPTDLSHPEEQVSASGVVHDTVRGRPDDVKVDLAGCLAPLGQGRRVNPPRGGYGEGLVRLTIGRAFKSEMTGVTVPRMACTVAEDSHSLPCTGQGTTSVLGWR